MTEPSAVIVAAVVAGFVAFLSLIISKEQTVSNFRQQWIDDLRKDVAEIAALVSGIYLEWLAKRGQDQTQLWERVKTDLTGLIELMARVRLRLNPDEKRKTEGPATRAVLSALAEIESVFDGGHEFRKLNSFLTRLTEGTQVILKENGKRVRSGEPVYKTTKWATFGFALAAFVGWLIWKY